MEKLETVPAASHVYLSKASTAETGRADSGIFLVVLERKEGRKEKRGRDGGLLDVESSWGEDVHAALRTLTLDMKRDETVDSKSCRKTKRRLDFARRDSIYLRRIGI